jgi:hypothetical protein
LRASRSTPPPRHPLPPLTTKIPMTTSIKLFELKPAFRIRIHPGMPVGLLLHESPSNRISDNSDTHPAVAAAFFPISEGLLAPVAWVPEQWDKLVTLVKALAFPV